MVSGYGIAPSFVILCLRVLPFVEGATCLKQSPRAADSLSGGLQPVKLLAKQGALAIIVAPQCVLKPSLSL
ncbi:hypothetical protein G3435_13650 [Pseudomonas sp. MAFF212428]|uniref:Uncharacterized protein n=1 Tax=Pseudomonas brassicae TaxID=2708063 RepID=A0A6B3NS34_9PSED|nr:hypothetical protein [Pseudomonas brassicae]NER60747.1 hypothetical protein [Pseudomonas brassicae]NER63080.1 hypothetical protein [Pseudomonas brassicae]